MNELVEIKNNQVITSSRKVAEHFDKQHKDVLEGIRRIIQSAEKSADWFYQSKYKDNKGRIYTEYLMNRDGFSLLVMSFTGEKALQWKIKYIQAFNQMEEELKNQNIKPIDIAKEQRAKAMLINARTKQSELWLKLASKTNIPEYRQIAESYAANTLAGREVFALPVVSQKTFSATEVGKILGVSANKIGRIASQNNLKTEQFGKYFYDKSANSSKEVETFRYYENAITEFRKRIN